MLRCWRPPAQLQPLAAGCAVQFPLSDIKVLLDSIFANRTDIYAENTKWLLKINVAVNLKEWARFVPYGGNSPYFGWFAQHFDLTPDKN